MRVEVLVLVLWWGGSDGFGRGAPGDVDKSRATVCEDMMPWHFNASMQPPSTNPFNLSTSPPHCLFKQLIVTGTHLLSNRVCSSLT